MTPEMTLVIATVDRRLKEILAASDEGHSPCLVAGPRSSRGGYLQRGTTYTQLPTKTTSSGAMGSRHDHLVSILCGVGVRSVQRARAATATARLRGESLPKPPVQRGCKRTAAQAPDGPEEDEEDDSGDAGWTSLRWQVLANVPGHYLEASRANPQAHATALVLGRLHAYTMTHAIPDGTVEGLVKLFHLAGVGVGQKYHGRQTIGTYGGILARLCGEAAKRNFWLKPKNLTFPSAWRLVFDGVTLQNGMTVTVVLVVFTSEGGEITS